MQVQRATGLGGMLQVTGLHPIKNKGDTHAITLRILVLDLPGEGGRAGQRPRRLCATKEGGGERKS